VKDTEDILLRSAANSYRKGSITAMSDKEMPLPQSGIGSTAGSTMHS
jgi:hypothetical protein